MRIATVALLFGLAAGQLHAENLLVDDFSEPGQSALGTQWQGFTDRVMGGRSTIQAGYLEADDNVVLAMRGEVSLENNGGFVQVRLPLARRGSLDASAYRGMAVEVRGAPGSYFIHLRTERTRRPWQYFAARLPVTDEWTRVELPFSSFAGESVSGSPDVNNLLSLAIVAGTLEFQADIEIRRVEMVR